MKDKRDYVSVLSIAGLDPIGAAGILADIKTIQNHNIYAMGLITSMTSQNTMAVYDVKPVDKNIFESQINTLYEDITPQGVKIGMLASSDINELLFHKLIEENQKNIVLDPVMIASTGKSLISDETFKFIKNKALSLVDLLTPNKMEAEALSDMSIRSEEDLIRAGKRILKNMRGSLLIKGGHIEFDEDIARDYLFLQNKLIKIDGPRIKSNNTHGTGCLLSSAITCNLSLGKSMEESVILGKKYLNMAIGEKLNIGKGKKPVNHLACRKFTS